MSGIGLVKRDAFSQSASDGGAGSNSKYCCQGFSMPWSSWTELKSSSTGDHSRLVQFAVMATLFNTDGLVMYAVMTILFHIEKKKINVH